MRSFAACVLASLILGSSAAICAQDSEPVPPAGSDETSPPADSPEESGSTTSEPTPSVPEGDSSAPVETPTVAPPEPTRRTIDDLLRLATEGDLPIRLHAIRKLGRTRHAALSPKLIAWLGDAKPEIRAASCSALGDLGAKESVEALTGALTDKEPSVVTAAIRACEQLDSPAAITRLVNETNMSTPAIRRATGQALAALTGRQFGDLGSDDASEVAIAWKGWQDWWEVNRSRAPLAWAFAGTEDRTAAARLRSQRRLGELGDSGGFQACIRGLGDSSPAVAAAALRSCERLGGLVFPGSGVETEAEQLATRTAWLTWWERNQEMSRVEWLLAGLRSEAAITRASAARALAAHDPSSPREPEASADPLVTPAALALRVPALIEALADPSPAVRSVADAALRDLTGRTEGFDAESGPEMQSEAAGRWRAWWKANQGRDRYRWTCDMMLNDDRNSNRVAAAQALAHDDDDLTLTLLINTLRDEHAPVRAAALSALRLRTGQTLGLDPEAAPDTQRVIHAQWDLWLQDRVTGGDGDASGAGDGTDEPKSSEDGTDADGEEKKPEANPPPGASPPPEGEQPVKEPE